MDQTSSPARFFLVSVILTFLVSAVTCEYIGFTSNSSIRAYPPSIPQDVTELSAGNGTSRAQKRKEIKVTLLSVSYFDGCLFALTEQETRACWKENRQSSNSNNNNKG